MSLFPPSAESLIDSFARLPGVGRKSAARLALYLLNIPKDDALHFAETIVTARENIKFCPQCQSFTENDLCDLCRSSDRDRTTLCVVAEISDLAAVERCREYRGLYHVLHGVVSPAKRVSPDDLRIKELLARVESGQFREVILATNPDTDGDTTALYLARLLRPFDVNITRLAYGLPMGGHVEHTDELTILRALDGRLKL